MSKVLDFYRGRRPDSEGRTLEELWNWSDIELERVHDFIQWMFPLDEPSSVNPDAPLLTPEDISAFRADPQLQAAMRKSFVRFLAFLGLAVADDGRVTRAEYFDERIALWKYQNHNWLRITRLIKCLRILGFEAEAAAFWTFAKELHEKDGLVSEDSFTYWRSAARGLPLG